VDFLAEHQLYIVLTIVLIIWVGLGGYLLRLDGKVTKLEKSVKK